MLITDVNLHLILDHIIKIYNFYQNNNIVMHHHLYINFHFYLVKLQDKMYLLQIF